jgi:sulfonate transport system substrate-binding protein
MSLSKPRVRAVGSALAVSALLAAALVVPAATASAKAAPKAKVTLSIGDQGESLQEPQTLSGESKNAPYNVKWTDFTDGPDLDAAFAANKIDLGFEGDTAGLVATAGGSGVDVIAAVQEAPDAYFQVVASASSGITSIAGLKGKTVAFTPDSASEGYLLEALRQAGLSLSDITPVNITGGSSLTAVLASGQADAAVLASVQILTALAQDPSDVRLSAPNAVCDVLLVASKKSLANPAKRAALLQFVTRTVQSGIWVNKN